jgi:hypothetical protein
MTEMLRVFINRAPWNELLFLGESADDYQKKNPKTGKMKRYYAEGIKWRSRETHSRGLVLLYTSKSRGDDWALYERGYLPSEKAEPGVDYDPKDYKYTKERLMRNRGKLVGVAEIVHGDDDGYIYMINIRRFPQPIDFTPRRGCVTWAKASFSLVEEQLRKTRMLRSAKRAILPS